MEGRQRRLWGTAATLAITVYFFRLTRSSLHAYFSGDDVTNLYRSCSYPLSRLIRACLLFFETSPFYRPLGSAWYRSIFYFAGFHPLPFHAVNLLLIAVNTFLTYAVARRLSHSREIGVLAALLGCYHPAFTGLSYDTAFIYDVLCYLFYLAAFAFYLRVRQAGRFLTYWETAFFCVLYICALESKEMAVTLPVFLAVYEWIEHRPRARQARVVLITAALTLLFVTGRIAGADSLIGNAAYRPEFTWTRFMETSRMFLGTLFFQGPEISPAIIVLVWIVMLAIAWIAKSSVLRLAWLFLIFSAMPIAFLTPRGASQYYVPLFGWVLYAAAMLACGTAWLAHRLPGRWGAWMRSARAPVIFACLMLILYGYYKKVSGSARDAAVVDEVTIRAIDSQLHSLQPSLPPKARLLIRNEPDDYIWDNLLSLVRLSYGNDEIVVDRLRKMKSPPSESQLSSYDHVFDYRDGGLTEAPPGQDPRLKPMMVKLLHSDFSPITAGHGALPGELVMIKATGLGVTRPEVEPGHPFPQDPLAEIPSRIEVKVNGRTAEIILGIGWPKTDDTYRVDFRLPAGVQPGTARVELAVRGIAAAPQALAVSSR